MLEKSKFCHDQQENSTISNQENEADEVKGPPPIKRRGANKRVISVPIGDGDGSSSRSKAEVYAPPDSWSWRKYGQKPIKGSPFPRGYYRCSSSKGCPARKQVERSCHDPTMLLITYSCDHNHSLPTSTKHPHPHPSAPPTAALAPPNATSASTTSSSEATESSPEEFALIDIPNDTVKDDFTLLDLDSGSGSFSEFARELGWSSHMGSTFMDGSTLVGPSWPEVDMAVMLTIGEDDDPLFGDLEELPECSAVFRQAIAGETPCCAGTG